MKLKTPIAYFEVKQDERATYRGPALGPKFREYDDGSNVLSFSELFRIKAVDVVRVVRDTPSTFEVVSIVGERVTLRPLTLAAYRRYIKGRDGIALKSQKQLEEYYSQTISR